MWQHNYTPIHGSLLLSSLVAALPIFVLLFLLGIRRSPAWKAALWGLGTTVLVSFFLYGMPVGRIVSAAAYGAAYGLFPIGWIVIWALYLYRLTLDTGKFEAIKHSLRSLTRDPRLQTLLIAFAFGAFLEGAAGFGTPVAVAAAMLAGLGFSPFHAAAICLLANTAPVAFGSIAIPIVTLAGITGLPLMRLSAGVGRMCAPVSLFIPSYLVVVMGGWSALGRVFPAALLCGVTFAGLQFTISNFVGPQLTDLIASLCALGVLVVLFLFWKPKDKDKYELTAAAKAAETSEHSLGQVFQAWSPYLLLVICVLLWGWAPMLKPLNSVSIPIKWPGLHNLIARVPPVTATVSPYAAIFNLNWLSASGTSCMIACILSCFALRVPPMQALKIFASTMRQLTFSLITLAGVLGLAFLMNYSGATGTLGLALRGHWQVVPLLQRDPGLAGCVPHRLRYFRQRAFRQLASSDGHQAGVQSGADGVGEFSGRRDGQDDQLVQHRGGSGGHQHEAGRRSQAVPLYAEAQRVTGLRDRPDRFVLHVRRAWLAAVGQRQPGKKR